MQPRRVLVAPCSAAVPRWHQPEVVVAAAAMNGCRMMKPPPRPKSDDGATGSQCHCRGSAAVALP